MSRLRRSWIFWNRPKKQNRREKRIREIRNKLSLDSEDIRNKPDAYDDLIWFWEDTVIRLESEITYIGFQHDLSLGESHRRISEAQRKIHRAKNKIVKIKKRIESPGCSQPHMLK